MTTYPTSSSAGGPQLEMKSINGKTYRANNERDAEFLRLASRFFETADKISRDPRKRKPKLRWT